MKLPDLSDYAALRDAFRWRIPDRYNIAVDVCDRWAASEPERPAIIEVSQDWLVTPVSFGWFREHSNRLANALRARGVGRGDRVAILLPQGRAVLAAHLAAYKLGAIAVPLAALFGVDALAYRLEDSGAKVVVTNDAGLAKLSQIAQPLPELSLLISTDGADGRAEGWDALLAEGSPDFVPAETTPDDPALMIYTSGTTGNPKGALHGHRVLPGHLPGVQMPHEFMPRPGDLAWTPADWAWAGGSAQHAAAGAAFRCSPWSRGRVTRFEPEEAYRLMPGSRHPQRLRAADRAQDAARRRQSARALPVASPHGRGGRRGPWCRDAGLGAGSAGPDDQRGLWPDRMQSRARIERRHRREPAGLDRQGRPRPSRSRSSGRTASSALPARRDRSRCAGPTR